MADIVRAPWSPKVVAALMLRQQRTDLHPYTCPDHHGLRLEPTPKGWRCPHFSCRYEQDWAHAIDCEEAPR